MIEVGAWVVVMDSVSKYFGYEGEITRYNSNVNRWEVLLVFEDKYIRINLLAKDIKAIKKEVDGEAKRQMDYFFIKNEIDKALDNRDEAKFMELTGRLKVVE